MGRTEMTRTFTVTKITFATVSFENGAVTTGKPVLYTVNGSVTDTDKALDLIRKAYDKKGQYVIMKLEQTDTTYAMSIEDFVKYAHVVEPKPAK
jgi:hypothetical protein